MVNTHTAAVVAHHTLRATSEIPVAVRGIVQKRHGGSGSIYVTMARGVDGAGIQSIVIAGVGGGSGVTLGTEASATLTATGSVI